MTRTGQIDENEDTRATDTVKGEMHNTMDSERRKASMVVRA